MGSRRGCWCGSGADSENWLVQHAHEGMQDASLQGQNVLGHDDIDDGHRQNDKHENSKHREDVFPRGQPLFDRNVLPNGVQCGSANIFGPKDF